MVDGLLFFPVTPFTPDDRVNLDVLAEQVDRGLRAGTGTAFKSLIADGLAAVAQIRQPGGPAPGQSPLDGSP